MIMKKIILFSFVFVMSILQAWGQAACPANNTCATAYSLTPNPVCTTTSFNIASCTDEGATGDCASGTTQKTIWFQFVASATTATVTVVGGAGSDMVVGASSACGSATRPTGGTCTDITGDGGTETLSLSALTIGTTYYVSVYEFNGDASGTGTICVVGAPANDVCSGAITLTPSAGCSPILGSTRGANDNNETGDCTTGTERAVWYKFVATSATHEIIVTGTTGFDPVVQVINACGSATNPTGGACVNITGDAGKEVIYISSLTIGNTYLVQVHDFNGDNGANSNFNICVSTPVIPNCGTNPTPTDACASAPLINNLDSFCGSTAGFTIDGASVCGFAINNNSYFRFVAASSEVTLNFWLTGGGSCSDGIQIALLSGACGSLTPLACGLNPTGGTGSSGVFNVGGLTPGTTYYVMIDGYAGDVCTYSLAAVSGVAAQCATCDVPACAINNTVADDYYTLQTETVNNGNWNAFGATAATGTPYTANGVAKTAYTVCSDITATSSTFIGFDYLLNAIGSATAIDEIKNEGTFTLIGVTQELSTGVCTTLIPSGTNAFGMPEFNDTGGTPGTTAGAFDHTKPLTVCLSYSLPASATLGGTISGFTVMGYGCATPTGITLGATGACSGTTYTKTLTVNFDPTDLPTPAVVSGTSNVSLTVNGQVFAITPAEQVAGSKTITLTGLNADGLAVNLEAYFTTSSGCKFTLPSAYTAPTCVCASPPSVSIVESSVTICGITTFNYTVANGPATLSDGTGTGTLSTTSLPNGTSTFTYTPSVGDTGNTFTITATIADPDGAGACVASSDAVTVTVNPATTVSIAPTSVYAGTRTIVATTNVVSGTVTYIFKKNGSTVQSSTSNVWNATGLLQNDVITCEISVAGGCSGASGATSNSVTVQAPLDPNLCTAVVAAADQSVSCGTSTTLTSTLRTIYAVTQTSCDAVTVTSPTAVTLTDDAVTANIPIGFSFNFFGTPYTDCRIHSNGIVSFGGQTYTGYTAVTIPNGATAPNNYIAGFYTDINPACGGSITYKMIGTAPNRQFVVTYTDIEPYYDGACSAPSGDAVSFQIILEETTNLVRIIMIKVPSTFVAGFSGSRVPNATQGIEAGDGSIAFTTPGRNWQVWNNPGLTPAYRDCTTFGPVNYSSSFVNWRVGASQVSTSNPYTFNATATTTYTGTWNINGTMCTDDVVVTVTNSSTMTLETATNPANCTTPNGTIPMTFSNVANGTYTVSYQKDGSPQTASVTVASGTATLSNLSAGIYSNFSINVGGCIVSATGSRTLTTTLPTITLGTATNSTNCATPDGTIPLTFTNVPDGTYTLSYTKDGVATTSSITATTASSGTLTYTGSGGTSINGTYGSGTNISIAVPALPAGAVVTSTTTRITYTSISPSFRSELRVRATPPAAVGSLQDNLQPSTLSSSGTVTNASIGTWGTGNPTGTWVFAFAETVDDSGTDANISNITITINYTVAGGATLSGLGAGTYSNFSITALGCTGTTTASRVITAPGTPAATGVTICQGASAGSLTSSAVCTTTTTIAQGATFNTGTLANTDPRWYRNSSGTTCDATTGNFEYYDIFTFTVSTTGSYTFNMCTTGTDWDGHASLYQNAFDASNPCGTPANFISANNDSNTGGSCENDPRITATLTAGTTYILVTTGFNSAALGNYGWTFSGPASATLITPPPTTIQWYTSASGGTAIGSGSPFNPVGVVGSGLANTNTAGTTTFYAACPSDPACRTAVSYVITPSLTPTVSIAPFNVFASSFPTSQTITATATNAGTATLNYDFRKNSVSQQSSASNVWNATGLALGDLITCVVTVTANNGACINTSFTSATSNTATVRTSPNPSGLRGNALTYNGTNQSVSVPDMNLLDMTSNYTLEVWAKFGSIAAGTQAIISKNTGSDNGYYLSRNGSALVFDGMTTGGSIINATDWHHIAVVNDNGTRRLYVNGWEQALSGSPIAVVANTQNLSIGYDAKTNTYFNGQIDEVRIWSTVRSQFTLRENMHLVLSGLESNLVSYYQCNQSAGTSLTDIISQNHGTLQNSPPWGISHANVGRGTSNTIDVNSSGLKTFTNSTNCKLNFSGALPMGDVVVSRVEGLPAGVNLVTTNGTIISVYTKYYWVINNFGTTNTGLTVSPTFILGPNQISPTETLSGLKMDKRPTNQDIAWTAYNAQTFVNITTGEVTFTDIDGFSEFVIHSEESSPLPTTMLAFAGERKDAENVMLRWNTNLEMNNKGFEVQASTDKQNFEMVTFVDGKGDINTPAQYNLLVANANDAYYRLKQVDNNGNFTYSAIVFIAGEMGDLIVYPNPTKGEINLRLGNINRLNDNLKIKLYDLAGKLIFETEAKWEVAEQNLKRFVFDIQANGQYILSVHTRGKSFKKKIQVIK
ncbi:MAG: T9SS C-terminal target domain-containing protein [Bacteroidetes bacterium]|nr:MAG: T9SS C-terminal target domain-containing protein [Bacteroidota bacterium]